MAWIGLETVKTQHRHPCIAEGNSLYTWRRRQDTNLRVKSQLVLPPPLPKTPCPNLLAHLDADQRPSFLRLWDHLLSHQPDVAFGLHGAGGSPSVIDDSGDVLRKVPDVFFTSKTDFRLVLFDPVQDHRCAGQCPCHLLPPLPRRRMPSSTSTWPPDSPRIPLPHTPAPSPRKIEASTSPSLSKS